MIAPLIAAVVSAESPIVQLSGPEIFPGGSIHSRWFIPSASPLSEPEPAGLVWRRRFALSQVSQEVFEDWCLQASSPLYLVPPGGTNSVYRREVAGQLVGRCSWALVFDGSAANDNESRIWYRQTAAWINAYVAAEGHRALVVLIGVVESSNFSTVVNWMMDALDRDAGDFQLALHNV